MNGTLVMATLRQRLSNPMRVILLTVFVGFPMLVVVGEPRAGVAGIPDVAFIVALILGAGLIGQDASSGVLQLLFARPVRRSEYLFSRWGAVAAAAAGAVLLQIALGAGVIVLRGATLDPAATLAVAADRALGAIGVVSVLALFSTLIGGFGDLALMLLAQMLSAIVQGVGAAKSWAPVLRAGQEMSGFLQPHAELVRAFAGSPSWFAIASWASTVTLCLALAIVALNRKELSYAAATA